MIFFQIHVILHAPINKSHSTIHTHIHTVSCSRDVSIHAAGGMHSVVDPCNKELRRAAVCSLLTYITAFFIFHTKATGVNAGPYV